MDNKKLDAHLLGTRLRGAREMAGLSQAQVAKMLSLHRPAISEIEAGRRKVSAEEMAKLVVIYDVKISWLTDTNEETDEESERIKLAARELSKLKKDDLDRVMHLLKALRKEGN